MGDLIMTYEDKDGRVRLLPGYKFDPTDEVLVDFYLKRRVFAQPLPFQIISDFDVFQTEPWGLPGGDGKIFNERKCFFYNTMGHGIENLDVRVVGSGEWRVMEKGKDVPIPQNKKVIGKRNTLKFWKVQGASVRRTKWAVYRIFQNEDAKEKATGSNGEISNGGRNTTSIEVIDFNVKRGSFSNLPPMTPSSSEGTESP
ncbi:NAC domain-containing protein 83-like [Lotus japonicus]|uniref:NAC domain-containing protein 83-like n=1 Tax=Lotus japonicus TaxID=34305 RepID=UPI00259006EF|nr:NAC domain-containing protein 83-like [Lotus japonicus]